MFVFFWPAYERESTTWHAQRNGQLDGLDLIFEVLSSLRYSFAHGFMNLYRDHMDCQMPLDYTHPFEVSLPYPQNTLTPFPREQNLFLSHFFLFPGLYLMGS